MMTRLRVTAASVCALAATALVACQLFVDLGATQCAVDGDCSALGQGYACIQSWCAPSLPAGNAEAGVGADAAARCSSNEQCMNEHFGDPLWTCNRATGRCASLKTADTTCTDVYPKDELKNDNVVLVGAFYPLVAGLTGAVALSERLALDELNKAGGLPAGPGQPRRPMAAVFCDSEPALAEKGLRHLVQEVGVPAVIGLFSDRNLTTFVQDVTAPAGVFVLNPNNAADALRNANVDQLVWSLLGYPSDVAVAYRPLLQRTEQYVRARLQSPARDLKVAVITSRSPFEEAMQSTVLDDQKGIVVNGKSAAANTNAGTLRVFRIDSWETDPTAAFNADVAAVTAFAPDIVLLLTSDEASAVVPALEEALASDAGAAALPVYLLSSRNARSAGVLSYMASDALEPTAAKRKRFLGVQYASATDLTQKTKWLTRMADFTKQSPSVYSAAENFYDAVYWLAYGLYAAGPGAPSSGESFKAGVRRIAEVAAVEKPESILHPGDVATLNSAFTTISRYGTASFVGTLGPPDFNLFQGAWNSVGSVFCYPPPPFQDDGPIVPSYDVLRYNKQTGQLEGDFSCFLGFP